MRYILKVLIHTYTQPNLYAIYTHRRFPRLIAHRTIILRLLYWNNFISNIIEIRYLLSIKDERWKMKREGCMFPNFGLLLTYVIISIEKQVIKTKEYYIQNQ